MKIVPLDPQAIRSGGIFRRATPGLSEFAHLVDNSVESALWHSQQTLTSERKSLRARFRQLAEEWKEATEYESSPERIARHPAYQEIMLMGWEAVPLILEDLEATSAPWFWALRAITGEDPVPYEDRGYLDRMTRAWITWGVRKILI
ncbi:MAG: hypothetical protein ABW277_18755 [Longimicrobiaceae bacterium]